MSYQKKSLYTYLHHCHQRLEETHEENKRVKSNQVMMLSMAGAENSPNMKESARASR